RNIPTVLPIEVSSVHLPPEELSRLVGRAWNLGSIGLASGGVQSRLFGKAVMTVPFQTHWRKPLRASYSWLTSSSRLPGSGRRSTGRVANPAADTAAGDADPGAGAQYVGAGASSGLGGGPGGAGTGVGGGSPAGTG